MINCSLIVVCNEFVVQFVSNITTVTVAEMILLKIDICIFVHDPIPLYNIE